MSLDKELIDMFITEARELLDKALELLEKLRNTPEDSETVNELFRIFHTLKGNAGMVGLEKLSALCHKVEDFLKKVSQGIEKLDKQCIDKLLALTNELTNALSELEEKNSIENPTIENLDRILNDIITIKTDETSQEAIINKEAPQEKTQALEGQSTFTESSPEVDLVLTDEDKKRIASATARGYHVYRVDLKFSVDPALMVFRYFQALHRLSEVGEVLKVEPENINQVKSNVVKLVIAVRKLEELEEAIKEIQDLESFTYVKIKPEELGISATPIELESTNRENVLTELEKLIKRVEEEEAAASLTTPTHAEQRIEEIKVNVKSLDELFNLVGELVLIKSRLYSIAQQFDSPQLKEVLTTFSRLVNELQDQVMRLRLVPLHQLFRSLPAFVKDLAIKYGKDVDLYYEGGEIALDRKVLERIVDPLKRLLEIIVRDSIEQPEVRVKKGKPSVGSIKISASREGNQVIIIVEDDGTGLDYEEIKYRAIELGLTSPSVVDKMSPEEIVLLATMPGFSMKDGRYAGLDSVRKSIESLGGVFEVYSRVDTETRYTIKIPVSMATIRALLVRLGADIYAIPISSIVSIVNIENIERIASKNLIRFQEKLIPLYDLAELLGVSSGFEKQRRYAIIVEKRNKYSAVLVDEALGQEDIVVKALSKALRNIRGIAGATILGDGHVCLILDVSSLIP